MWCFNDAQADGIKLYYERVVASMYTEELLISPGQLDQIEVCLAHLCSNILHCFGAAVGA